MLEELNDAVRRSEVEKVARFLLGENPEDIEIPPEPCGPWDLNSVMTELSIVLRRYGADCEGTLLDGLGRAVQAGVRRSFTAGMRAGARLAAGLLEGRDSTP